MSDVAAMRQALAANVAAITGAQVTPYMLANPTPPTVEVYPAEINYDLAAQAGADEHFFTVRVIVSETTDISGQKQLDEFMSRGGAKSIKTKVETDKTLGGECDTLRVTECTGARRVVMEGRGPLLAAEWRVRVLV